MSTPTFPLPAGYYYGPVNGPQQSISGQYQTDKPEWVAGLKLWQQSLGIETTGIWDEVSRCHAQLLQVSKGWQAPPGNGYIYLKEWNEVVQGGWRPEVGKSPQFARFIGDITGVPITGQFGVGGTDLGIPFRLGNGSVMYLFGDTFEGEKPGSAGWRSPVGLRSQTGATAGTSLATGVRWDNAAGGGYAKELTENYHQTKIAVGKGGAYSFSEYSVIPSGAVYVNGKGYMFTSSVHDWNSKNWITNFCFVSTCSDIYGENWSRSDTFWPNNGRADLHQQITVADGRDGYIYAVGSSFSRAIPGMLLMRVEANEASLLDIGSWNEWGFQNNMWSWGPPGHGTPFLSDSCGETSLQKVGDKWVFAYFDPDRYSVVIRVTDEIDHVWSDPVAYVHGGDWLPAYDRGYGYPAGSYAQLYGGYIHPDSTPDSLFLTVSQWNTGAGHPYRAMLFEVSLP
ncbi:DUF4185 domain-containing protein [Williamsia herbipolensis]|uniref:DUF4185 domain-containing protein n=1 Tax=Williamsia herbipolensis TaxID=1603258 RepID=UPI001364DAE4|nr:DUF4185 domain-containing protein [Williamsia herbipolensis]